MTPEVLLDWVRIGSLSTLLGYCVLAAVYGKRIIDRWHQLAAQKRHHGATVLIDPGDGKPVPLDQAPSAAVAAAMTALETYQKAKRSAEAKTGHPHSLG